jgi:hypothetical protein
MSFWSKKTLAFRPIGGKAFSQTEYIIGFNKLLHFYAAKATKNATFSVTGIILPENKKL